MVNFNPRNKLQRIANNSPQLWAVSYVEKENPIYSAEQDLNSAIEGDADAVIFINENSSFNEIHSVVNTIKNKYSHLNIGVNYLGDVEDPYGYKGTFFLCREYQLQIAWTDFSGVDLINERPPISLHDIENERPNDVFYCSGIHMKYSTLVDPSKTLIKSAYQAMGWVDGILITGPRTGILASPADVKKVREEIGQYPLGLASGVSAENARLIKGYIDFCLVGSSLFDEKKRIQKEKVKQLTKAFRENV